MNSGSVKDEDVFPVSPCEEDEEIVEQEAVDDGQNAEIQCKEDEEGEAQRPHTLRDPGTPSEVEEHNITHMPFRSWCPACVHGKTRDKHQRRDQSEKGLPEVVFDHCFLGAEGEEETVAIQVAKDRRTRMIFAHMVPKKGITHEFGADAMIEDLVKLGYEEMIFRCDGEPALKVVQEVKVRRNYQTIMENSPVGDSRANGAAERAAQAVEEQVRVERHGLENAAGHEDQWQNIQLCVG